MPILRFLIRFFQRTKLQILTVACAAAFLIAVTGTSPIAAQADSSEIGRSPLPGLAGATSWINSKPLTAKQLKGKVVLVDFWDYSCINCLRSLPYVNAWAKKYKDSGLVVIGVHTPEFPFEKEPPNVQKAVQKLGVIYPWLWITITPSGTHFTMRHGRHTTLLMPMAKCASCTSARANMTALRDGFSNCLRSGTKQRHCPLEP
jgi:thiol-disulfide isomerase/thioredoxin